ncbi:MAG: family 16 glycosylhydrolase [Patescibacteria group bacterium]
MEAPKLNPTYKANRNIRILLFIAVFVLIGITALIMIRAATTTIAVEVESGVISAGALKINDSNASGGQVVQFANSLSPGWQLVWSDYFDNPTISATNWTKKQGTEGHSQANYLTANVTYSGGKALIVTKRHCLSSTTEGLTDTNSNSSPCALGKITKYSSGGIDTVNRWQKGKIVIKAKLPVAQKGVWPALWMRNSSGWCTANYGEIDILEWYYDDRSSSTAPLILSTQRSTAASHMTCVNNSTQKVQHYEDAVSDLTAIDHVWEVEWSNQGIKYKLDGTVVRTSSRTSPDGDNSIDIAQDFGLSQQAFDTIMNQMWNIKINTQVIKSEPTGTQWHSAANNSEVFNPVVFAIDSVEVFQMN